MQDIKSFLRFAEGCRCYLKDLGLLSREDNESIKSGNPDISVIKRVFYRAHPEMVKLSRQMKKPVLERKVLRQFYCFEHNRIMHEEGHLACMTFPGVVVGRMNGEYVIELEPIEGAFHTNSDLKLKHGDWVLVHRMNVVEKVPQKFALKVTDYLKKLGMDKNLRFPDETVKYMKDLLVKGQM